TFTGSEKVVAPSGSCAAMVKLEYPELFHGDPAWRRRAEDLARRTHELSDFLVNVLGVDDVGAVFAGRVTYHMACHLRGLGLLTEPERLLRRVRGLEYVPLERADECCGFGGSAPARLTDTLMAGNRRGYAALADSGALRDHAKRVKEHTLAHLDRYLEQLEASVVRLGGRVHWAATAEDARRVVVEIARQSKCQRV